MNIALTTDLILTNKAGNELFGVFGVDWCVTWLVFSILKIFELAWTGYGNDVIGHDRKLKNELPNTNFPQITIKKN